MIEVRDVVKRYIMGSEELLALKGVNLTINKGEFTAIMGPSGSGKSTFMNIIGCLDRASKGIYKLNQKDISNFSDNELAHLRNKELGFVFQAFNLIPRMTVLENVELPMIYSGISQKKRREKALSALERVGLEDRVKHLPNEISGGQKQRVAIARSLVNSPSVILADEPTGNLDSKSSEDIMGVFQDLNNEGTTIILVTHENDIAKHGKRIVRFKDGQIIDDCPVENRIIL
jgi:putative ABC transport system ATP-binding protein